MRDLTDRIAVYKRLALHPVAVFGGIWAVVFGLYMLKLSDLLLYESNDLIAPLAAIVGAFLVGSAVPYVAASHSRPRAPKSVRFSASQQALLERRVVLMLKLWVATTCFEIVFSGGVPLYWLYTGSGKTYFDFGLPSLHGLLNALILTCSLLSSFLAQHSTRRLFKWVPFLLCVWGVVVVSRNLIVVNILQLVFLHLVTRPPLKLRNIVAGLVAAALFVLGFGALGDARSGAEEFVALALPSKNYPDFLPSGVLWIYIYITTPVNNLVHQIMTVPPEWNAGLTNAMSLLLPTVIRNIFYDANDFFKGDLISEAFNVSTAFLDIYKDIGYAGIAALSAAAGFFSSRIWRSRSLTSIFNYALISQCNLLSIFFNHYFYLPIVFQFVVVRFFFRPESRPVAPVPLPGARADWATRFPGLTCLWGRTLLEQQFDVAYLVRGKNEQKALPAFLRSLEAQTGMGRSLLVFLDSGSTDATLDLVRGYAGESVCLAIRPEEFVFGDTCNLLVDVAPAEFVMLLSAHVILTSPELVSSARRYFDDPKVAGISFRQVPHREIGASVYEMRYLRRTFGPAGSPAVSVEQRGAFSNAGSMLRKAAWRQVPFRSVRASEDGLWAADVIARGARVLYVPDLSIEHSHNESPGAAFRRVRINKVARFGEKAQWGRALLYVPGIFLSLVLDGEAPGRALKYALAHGFAYLSTRSPRWIEWP